MHRSPALQYCEYGGAMGDSVTPQLRVIMLLHTRYCTPNATLLLELGFLSLSRPNMLYVV